MPSIVKLFGISPAATLCHPPAMRAGQRDRSWARATLGPGEPWVRREPRPPSLTQRGKNRRARRGCQGRGDGGKHFPVLLRVCGTPKCGVPQGGEGQRQQGGMHLTVGGQEHLFYLTD